MDTIETHIAKDREQLARAEASGDQAKVRHYAKELEGLETYRSHHPGDQKDPTSLEVHCDLNPDAPECRVYDDDNGVSGMLPRPGKDGQREKLWAWI